MATTEERVMTALERWEAGMVVAGYVKCETCGDWSKGECRACQPTLTVTGAMIVGLAMLAR